VARRRIVTGLFLALGSLVGAIAYRRRFSNRRARVDLYYDDGSMVSLAEGSPDGDRLLPLARDLLRAART
jgi:hypothetical protein